MIKIHSFAGTARILLLPGVIFMTLVFYSCNFPQSKNKAVPVIIKEDNKGGYSLYRKGEPYFIKGARTIGTQYMDLVSSIGGNSVRTGTGKDVQAKLDTALKYGLTVLYGLPMKSERDGFNYNNPEAVREQFYDVMEHVEKYKDHPAILMWAVGNELDYVPGNPDYRLELWDAVNEIAAAIHKVDPYHPVITVIGTGRKYKLKDMNDRLTELDAIGINSYGDIYDVPEWIREYDLDIPYVITEWGPTGHWQVKTNKWGVPVEETSTEKAEMYLERHRRVIASDPMCLGGYSFLWTQNRQERTHTWYNMFYDHGERKAAVDAMEYAWTGKWPENRAPVIDSLLLEERTKSEDILLKAGESAAAKVIAFDRESDDLSYEWEIYPENKIFGYAGHGEERPDPVNFLISNRNAAEITFNAPGEEGNYRLFVYVRDEHHKIAVGNIAFHVEE